MTNHDSQSQDVGGQITPLAPPAENDAERETWPRCTMTLLKRCNDGRMRPWWGTDGHNGRERFYTCDRCGRT